MVRWIAVTGASPYVVKYRSTCIHKTHALILSRQTPICASINVCYHIKVSRKYFDCVLCIFVCFLVQVRRTVFCPRHSDCIRSCHTLPWIHLSFCFRLWYWHSFHETFICFCTITFGSMNEKVILLTLCLKRHRFCFPLCDHVVTLLII